MPGTLDRMDRPHPAPRGGQFAMACVPWVISKNLASCGLSLAMRRLGDDWQELNGYRPVLCETFVEEGRFRATCYRAANWERIGATGGDKGKSIKGVYVLPLCANSREVLRGERDVARPAKPPSRAERGRSGGSDRRFTRQWEMLVASATAVAEREDARWQKRRRVFSTLLIMLFVFRLGRRPAPAGLSCDALRAVGTMPAVRHRPAAGRAAGSVLGQRGAREARRGRLQDPAQGRSSPTVPTIPCGRDTASSLSTDRRSPCRGNCCARGPAPRTTVPTTARA